MAFVFRAFDNGQELVDYLNDIVVGKTFPATDKVYGLHGLTLIINTPTVRTVTFADAAGAGLAPKAILEQIHTVHAELAASVTTRAYGHSSPPGVALAVQTATYVIDKDGTANAILGFNTAADTTVGANAVTASDIVTVTSSPNNRLEVIHA